MRIRVALESVRTSVTELLGVEHPVLQAPMASVATPELAAAVSNAGGLGALGSAMLAPEELRREAEAVRALTDRPFQLNFFCHRFPQIDSGTADAARAAMKPLYDEVGLGPPPEPSAPMIDFDESRLEALLEIAPVVVSFHFGLPGADVVAACREAGLRILASATTVEEARHLEAAGVDAVVAQGAEAGGHRGSFLVGGDDGPVGTLSLVPQVVDAVKVPVIAAGGIADGRGLAAALALGAGAVQMGTAFVLARESGAPEHYRKALAESSPEHTTITRNFSGRPARVLANRITDEAIDPLPYPAQMSLTMPLRLAGEDPREHYPMWAGQGAPLARELRAAEIVERTVAEARRVRRDLCV
jgi:nitronate monooxygenase